MLQDINIVKVIVECYVCAKSNDKTIKAIFFTYQWVCTHWATPK